MFTPKPKNIVGKVIELTSGLNTREASHTWMSSSANRTSNFGSTSQTTYEQRRDADRQRKLVSRYADSKISQLARTNRGRISRVDRDDKNPKSRDSALMESVKLPQSPVNVRKSESFYPDFRPKL